jgi:hypothetical protein
VSSFARMCTVTASTKRLPAISGGKRGAAVTQVASLKCTPLDPIDPALRQRLGTDAPMEALQTFCGAVDVKEGDILVVGSREYPVKSAAEWTWQGTSFVHLILEDLKK